MTHHAVSTLPDAPLAGDEAAEYPRTGLATRHDAPLAGAGAAVSVPSAASMTQLLMLAVEKGTPVEQLKELVALHEHMEARDAAKEFARALAAFQAECPRIGRNKTADITTKSGSKFDYTYTSLDEVARIVNPILFKHGLSYGWDMEEAAAGKLTVTCTLLHMNGHSRASRFTLPTESASAMSAQQKYGAALTFGQRRTLEAVLGITTTDSTPDEQEADPTPIDDDQLYQLEDLLSESGADKARFLTFMGVERLADIRAIDYARGVSALTERVESKRRRAQGAAS
jgi:hypothetical protein